MADFTMRFPCSVGDTVYTVDKTKHKILPKTVVEISWKQNSYGKDLGWGVYLDHGACGVVNRYQLNSLGKSWFLTEEDAQKALTVHNAKTAGKSN